MEPGTESKDDHGCNSCGGVPTYLTPVGLRCKVHLHNDGDESDDWIPLARKDSRQRHRLMGRQPESR